MALPAGPGVAWRRGPRVTEGIRHGVAVGSGVRVTQGFPGSWVGRIRAWSKALWVRRAEKADVSARFSCDAASGPNTQVSANMSTISRASIATISVFNQKYLFR